MIRVVVTGSECTGKTTLARALAEHYDAPWVPEYARQFVLDEGRAPDREDVTTIAQRQLELERRVSAEAADLLVQDTDLLSTVVYARHYFGQCPPGVEEQLRARRAELYLLADIEVPWVPDGEMRDRGDRREELQELFRLGLDEFGCSYWPVAGSVDERVLQAVGAIDRRLGRSATR